MIERLRAHLAESGLVPDGTTVLLGYSGGADSTCLLHLLKSLRVDVIAAHLHHGQRPEADSELALCDAFCKDLNVPFVTGRADVPKIAKETGVGIEEAGRHARYEFFEQCRHRTGAGLVATAHTRDDLVESVLLNLARGAGLHGLAGIQPKRGHIVRPLLPFSRAETRRYCDERGLWYHDDPANDDESLARVRVRKCVLPQLEAINAAAKERIAQTASLVNEEDRFLDGMAAAALEQSESKLNGQLAFLSKECEAAFDKGALLTLPRVLLARALRLATGALGSALDHAQTQRAIAGLANDPRGSVTAEGGNVVLEWTEATVWARSLHADAPFRFPLTLPGATVSAEFGWRLVAESAAPGETAPGQDEFDVLLDLGTVKAPLHFRSYEPGDSIQPIGFKGTKKVGAVLSEMRLTETARRRLPVVCDLLGPVWVPGGCIADRAKVTERSERCVRLRFGPI